jgi:dihydrofolate synthase/folylpolyglutamate synthase
MNQVSSPPRRIEPIVERLHALHPKLIDLSLERLQRLLAQLGHPERRLPPTIHVAGTNGKGSTCAMLRAMGEAAGWRVHVYTSPHLVRFNERFRVAGKLVSDAALIDALETIERVNDGAPITVFEVITATAFQLFAATPADLCVLEVGLGGRGDATNVIDRPAASAITSLSMDHREMLGDTLAIIAGEKAGIIKPGIPVATGAQDKDALDVLRAAAQATASPFLARGEAWQIAPHGNGLRFTDGQGSVDLPAPSLAGAHQVDNAGIAIAALRAAMPLPPGAYAGIARARWPARLQRLHGTMAARIPPGWELWLDGGHNPGGGLALAAQAAGWQDRPLHLVVGMKQAKDTAQFLRPLLPHATTIWAVQEPGQHLALPIDAIIAASAGTARPGPTVEAALRQLPPAPAARVLICGSLYLAGEVLKADGTSADE